VAMNGVSRANPQIRLVEDPYELAADMDALVRLHRVGMNLSSST